MDRVYVLVTTRYKGPGGALKFWGMHTDDNQKRSFGGYLSNIDACEKYTKVECEESQYNFPFYGTRKCHKGNWRSIEDFFIREDQLEELGCRPMRIYYF